MKFNWGTVTGVNPLRITLDGDTEPLPFAPDSLIDPLTLAVADRVRTELSGHRLIVLGRVGGLGLLSGRNLIINGDFRINQLEAVSGATVGGGDYFLDRWKAISTTSYISWTGDEAGRVLTIGLEEFSRGPQQILEARDMEAVAHTLSWEGTAVGAIYNDGDSTPSYASSPIVFTPSGSANVVVEFINDPAGDATLSKVKLELGIVVTPFVPRSWGEEMAICRRYLRVFSNPSGFFPRPFWAGTYYTSTQAYFPIIIEPPMRTAPTVSFSTTAGFSVGANNSRKTASSISADLALDQFVRIVATTDSQTVGVGALLRIGGGERVILDAGL